MKKKKEVILILEGMLFSCGLCRTEREAIEYCIEHLKKKKDKDK